MVERIFYLRKEQKDEESLELTPFQLSTILKFASDKTPRERLSIFNGFLSQDERRIFRQKIDDYFSQETGPFIFPSGAENDILPQLLELLDLPKELSDKVLHFCQLNLISRSDLEKLKNRKWKDLPLPVVLTWATLGKNLKKQAEHFLATGGVISVFSFKKAPNFYLEAVEALDGDLSVPEKILSVLIGKKDRKLEEQSHQFISVAFLPLKSEIRVDRSNNPYHIEKIVNRRLDRKFEKQYAALVLNKDLIKGHMDEVGLVLGTSGIMAVVFYVIDQIVKGKISSDLYSVFQTIVKITTHAWANLVDFYSQYKLFLEGENFFSQIKDFLRNKMGWREVVILLNGAVLDGLSESMGEINPLAGSFVYGLEPGIGTASTTLAGSLRVGDSNDGFFTRLKKLLQNPAVESMNVAAFLTLLTSIGLLGLAHQFHNPFWVVMVGGVSEPTYAFFLNRFFTERKTAQIKNEIMKSHPRLKKRAN